MLGYITHDMLHNRYVMLCCMTHVMLYNTHDYVI